MDDYLSPRTGGDVQWIDADTGDSAAYNLFRVSNQNTASTKFTIKGDGTMHLVGLTSSQPASLGTTQTGYAARIENSGQNVVMDIGGNGGNGMWIQSTNKTNLASSFPLLLNPIGGNVGIGTTTPQSKLDVNGSIRFGTDATACSGTNQGAQRMNRTNMEYCNGTSWTAYSAAGAGITSINGLSSGTQTFAVGTAGTDVGISSTTATHTFNIPTASATNRGALSATDWTTFNNKLGAVAGDTLSSASIWVGNAINKAAEVAVSGDVSLSNTGVVAVNKIKGQTVSTTATSTGQVLRYDGTNWTPNYVAMTDLRSTVTGSSSFATSCGTNQTLTYNSVGDTMSCTNIAISDSQVTFGSQSANKVFASPNGASGAPTFRALVAADLPAGLTTQWTTTGSDIYYSTGKVGVGATSPWTNLHTHQTGNAVRPLAITSNSNLNVTGNYVGMYFAGNSGGTPNAFIDAYTFANSDIGFKFGTYGGGGLQDSMVITGNGNVGIGNTSPSAKLDIGTAGSSLGTLRLEGNTSGYLQIQPSSAAGSWTMTLPSGAGTNGYFLKTDGSGNTSWASASGAPAGANTQIQFNNSGSFGADSGFSFASSPNKQVTISGTGGNGTPMLILNGSANDAWNHSINSLNANLSAGNTVAYNFGKSISSYNAGYMGFKYVGAGGTANLINFGFINTANIVSIEASGEVGIGTEAPSYKLDVQGGDINASGSVRAAGVALTSDERFKRDITTLDFSLEKILAIRGVKYNWRKDEFPEKHFSNRRQIGVIAQEIEAVYPEAVDTNKDGYKSVNYPALIAPAIEAIKTLYTKFLKHDAILAEQARQLASIEAAKVDKAEMEAQLKAKDQKIKELELRLERLEKDLSPRQ